MGVYATLIAEDGFEGAPAALIEFEDAAPAWADLWPHLLTAEQYIKPYPICRWAHAPIDAALALRKAHAIDPTEIQSVEIETFRESATALSCDVRAIRPTLNMPSPGRLPPHWPGAGLRSKRSRRRVFPIRSCVT